MSSNFLRYSTKRRDPLGALHCPRQPKETFYVPSPRDMDASLDKYIASLPTWYKRLLYDFRTVATDVEIWRAFRARKRLIIASDGSLMEKVGTFGWKITTDKHLPLFEGSGPVDGPSKLGCSTRSELGGFTTPLLLVTVLVARHWRLQHRCSFKWIAVSQVAAINRVTWSPKRTTYRPHSQTMRTIYPS
jgi:hypothetical protein